jgi:hypothetical protein
VPKSGPPKNQQNGDTPRGINLANSKGISPPPCGMEVATRIFSRKSLPENIVC